MMRFASLGSGSSGNALLVEAGATRVLLDCGFRPAELGTRLARLGLGPEALDAVLLTHEHGDHAGGVVPLVQRYRLPLYASRGTLQALARASGAIASAREISDAPFGVGEIEVRPYRVPHDAREPLQFVLGDGALRLGVLTDAGEPNALIARALSGLDALVLECNHDRGMLAAGPYPPWLKERIASPLGHLSNDAAAELLGALDCGRLAHVVAAHLSRHNNTAQLARTALANALGCTVHWIGVATQEEGFGWRELRGR